MRPQESSYIEVPEFTKLSQSMNLTKSGDAVYEGALTIWNPKMESEKLAEVMQLSSMAREKRLPIEVLLRNGESISWT